MHSCATKTTMALDVCVLQAAYGPALPRALKCNLCNPLINQRLTCEN